MKTTTTRLQFCCFVTLVANVLIIQGSIKTKDRPRCHSGRHYYNLQKRRCIECSPCENYQIIRRVCHDKQDTICGPFYEWKSNKGRSKTDRRKENSSHAIKLLPNSPTSDPAPDGISARPAYVSIPTDVPSVYKDEVQYWRTLCFALIGLVVIIALLLVTYCVISQLRKQRKKTLRDQEREIDEIYLRARLFSRDRLSTTEHESNLKDVEQSAPVRKKRLRRLYRAGGSLRTHDVIDEVFANEGEKYYSISKANKFRLGAIPEINEKLELEKLHYKVEGSGDGDSVNSDPDEGEGGDCEDKKVDSEYAETEQLLSRSLPIIAEFEDCDSVKETGSC